MTSQKARQVAAGIIVFDDKVLIAQRRRGKDLAFYWELPGGKLEAGETLEECLKRELLEEMNLEISVEKFFMRSLYDYEFGSFEINAFLAKCVCPQIEKICEHEQYLWVKPEELLSYQFSPADVPIIESYVKSVR